MKKRRNNQTESFSNQNNDIKIANPVVDINNSAKINPTIDNNNRPNTNPVITDDIRTVSLKRKEGLGIFFEMIKIRKDAEKIRYDSLSPTDQKIHLGRKYFVMDNVSIYIILSICAGSYLAGLLNFVGVPPEINGIILSLPVLAGFFQIIGAIISQKLHTQKRFVLFGIAVHRICLSIVFLYPLIFGTTIFCAFMIVTTYAVGFFVGTAVGPSASNWIVSLVPPEIRGGYFSRRERFSLMGVAAATMLVSLILDKSKMINQVVFGFAVVGAALLTVAIFDIVHVAKIYEPETLCVKKKFTFQALLEPILDKKFIKVIMIFVLWQASSQIAIPFMGIYYISNIKMDYTIIGIVTLIVTIEKALIVSRWGKFADRTSWDNVLKIAVLFYATSQTIQIFLSSTNFIWLYPFAMIIGNVAWSVLGIALFNIQFQFINHEKATIYIGVCGTISGLLGFGVALAGSFILKIVNDMSLPFSGYQVLILLSALLGFALSYYIYKKVR